MKNIILALTIAISLYLAFALESTVLGFAGIGVAVAAFAFDKDFRRMF